MPSTIVLFEDVSPDSDLNFPVTFRALVDYGTIDSWSIEAIEVQGAQGGWVDIDRHRALWPVLKGYLGSRAGIQAVEDQIFRETEHNAVSPTPRRYLRHAAE